MMPQHVAFVAFMLLERQRVAAFVLHLLLFASREGSVPSGEAFLGRFLRTLPPPQASSPPARHFPEDSCQLYLPRRLRPFWRGISQKILATKGSLSPP